MLDMFNVAFGSPSCVGMDAAAKTYAQTYSENKAGEDASKSQEQFHFDTCAK